MIYNVLLGTIDTTHDMESCHRCAGTFWFDTLLINHDLHVADNPNKLPTYQETFFAFTINSLIGFLETSGFWSVQFHRSPKRSRIFRVKGILTQQLEMLALVLWTSHLTIFASKIKKKKSVLGNANTVHWTAPGHNFIYESTLQIYKKAASNENV